MSDDLKTRKTIGGACMRRCLMESGGAERQRSVHWAEAGTSTVYGRDQGSQVVSSLFSLLSNDLEQWSTRRRDLADDCQQTTVSAPSDEPSEAHLFRLDPSSQTSLRRQARTLELICYSPLMRSHGW